MKDKTELFERIPVPKAVISLVVPTVISQLITVAYNMADTFFIGQIGNPNQVAAVSVCMPPFLLMTGLANLLGIGGSSLISRMLGAGNRKKAKQASAFSIWTALVLAIVYGLCLFLFRSSLFPAVGANSATYDYCCRYALWTMSIGAIPTVMNAVFAHLIRAEGYSAQASFGLAMGCILNIALDPVFIFVFKLEVAGAAIATMFSNLIALAYFLILMAKHRKTLTISINPRHYTWKDRIPGEVLLVGLPSCLMTFMGVFSNIVMNRLLVSYCNEALAGIGIAKKIDMFAFAVSNGMSQGVLPLIGYNYAAKNYKRMMSAIKTAFLYSLIIATVGTALLVTCAGPLVKAFINDPLTVEYGRHFQRIICITGPCISVTVMIISVFQAIGKKARPLFLSLLRKGGLDIPFMFLMNSLVGVYGIAWATPIADFSAMVISICLFLPFWKKLKALRAAAELA